ncbi:hypothetical protein UlMin_017007 [Ulmus minor]
MLKLNGTNYKQWSLREDKPAKLSDSSTPKQKKYRDEWERSNRCFLIIMRYHMEESIRDSIEGVDDHSSQFDAIRSSYNAQKEQWSLEEMTTILAKEEDDIKNGLGRSVSVVSNLEQSSQKKNFPHNYFSKQFKKKSTSGKPNAYTSVQSSGTKKDYFLGKCNFCHKLDEKSSMLWHICLGYISTQRIERLVKEGLLHDLNFANFDNCIDCIKGKLIAKVRKSKTNRCKDVLEIIHIDICGPFAYPVMGGYRYFITFIDDFSHYGYVELIREKLDTLEVFKIFKTKVELQKGKKKKKKSKWLILTEVDNIIADIMKLAVILGILQSSCRIVG